MKSFVKYWAATLAALVALADVSSALAQDYWGDTGATDSYNPYADGSSPSYDSGQSYDTSQGYDTSYTGGGDADAGGGDRYGGLLGESAFNYGYVEASYYWFDFDDDLFDSANGFGGALSVPIIDSLFVKGAVNYASSETALGGDVDYLDWQIGGGIGLPLTRRFDFILEGGLAHRSLDVGGIHDFDDLVDGYGWYVAPGVRVEVTRFLEVDGTVRYINVDGQDDVGFDVRALLHLTPHISVTGGALFTEDANQYGVGLRLSF